MYRFGCRPEFEDFLRRTAEDIIAHAVRGLVEEADRIVFEMSDVSDMYL